jgi:hypothetical protein
MVVIRVEPGLIDVERLGRLSGSCEITASGETRVFRPGDVLLVEDVDGAGHSSSTSEGFTVVAVVL